MWADRRAFSWPSHGQIVPGRRGGAPESLKPQWLELFDVPLRLPGDSMATSQPGEGKPRKPYLPFSSNAPSNQICSKTMLIPPRCLRQSRMVGHVVWLCLLCHRSEFACMLTLAQNT
jgi:hypothetical protein